MYNMLRALIESHSCVQSQRIIAYITEDGIVVVFVVILCYLQL